MENEPNEKEEWLTVQEAAKQLEVAEGVIRIALSEERLPFTLKYGRKLIKQADLNAYKERTRPDGVKPKGRPKKQPTSQPEI